MFHPQVVSRCVTVCHGVCVKTKRYPNVVPLCVCPTPLLQLKQPPKPCFYRYFTVENSKNRGYFAPLIPPFFNTFNTKKGILPPCIPLRKTQICHPIVCDFVTPICHPICHPILAQEQKKRENDQFRGSKKMVTLPLSISGFVAPSSLQIQASPHPSSSHHI